MKILLVDDEERNLKLLLDMLLPLNHTLLKAMNGRSALEILRQTPDADLVLLDIMMPDMDGYEVCSAMKADNALKDIPIIFITALSDETNQIKGLKCGAVDYVTKPFKKEILRTRVNTQLELKQRGDALKNTLKELKKNQSKLEELNLNLENIVKERTNELLLTQEVIIDSMASVAEFRDLETGLHISRTRNYVKLLPFT